MSNSDLKLNCDKIEYVSTDLIEVSNDSLNNVSAEKMELLKISIDRNGFCYPLIVTHDNDRNKFLDHDVKCASVRFQE
jgi:hypothetical protein